MGSGGEVVRFKACGFDGLCVGGFGVRREMGVGVVVQLVFGCSFYFVGVLGCVFTRFVVVLKCFCVCLFWEFCCVCFIEFGGVE